MQTVSTVSSPARTVNTASKDLLARILASENITVQHNPKASTAAFDTKNRVLILPAWTGMTNEVYDMLVGHEVGHALFTPHTDADNKVQGPWCGAAEEIAGTAHASVAQVYMNIVEDARIEKLMKEKFPGMRRDFYKAYEQFVASDFFGVKGRDLNKLTLIDRINLHYKMGTCMDTGIRFSPVEQSFIKRIDACRTFDDVKEIVNDIWEYESRLKEEAEKQKQNGTASTDAGDAGEDGDTTPIPTSGGDEQDDSDESGAANSAGDSSDDSADGNKQSAGQRGDGDPNKMTPQDDKSGASTGPGADKMQHKSAAPSSITQEKFDSAVKNMTDKRASSYEYYSLPSCNLDKIIISYAEIQDLISKHRTEINRDDVRAMHDNLFARARTDYAKFAADSAPVVSLMAKQFDLRKAADAAKRTSVARTGVLDTVRMVNYKITDDIFRRNAVVREGKNHGLVMFIDWSGSMGPTLLDTVKQLMQIALFCRRCNIPFEVYAFTSCVIHKDLASKDHYEQSVSSQQWNVKDQAKDAKFHMFSLLNFLSSKMRPNQFKQAMENLFAIAIGQTDGSSYYTIPNCLGLSSTPLDESIVAAMQIVPQFRADNRLQIVHSVFLTDGETSGSFAYGNGMYTRKFVTDPVTRKTYELRSSSTNTLLEVFRDRTGCNAIGFFLYGRKNLNYMTHLFKEYTTDNRGLRVEKMNQAGDYAKKQIASFSDDGFAIVHPTASGYTEQYIIRADMRVENTDAMDTLAADASMTKIKNAFMATAAKRMKSRVMLNRFIDLIAK